MKKNYIGTLYVCSVHMIYYVRTNDFNANVESHSSIAITIVKVGISSILNQSILFICEMNTIFDLLHNYIIASMIIISFALQARWK